MKSSTSIYTAESKRIAKRLLNHWKHKFDVKETADEMTIFMPDSTVLLMPKTETLDVVIDTQRTDFAAMEKVVIDHLNRMAQQQFEANWQHQAG